MDEGDYRGFTFSMRLRWINNKNKTNQTKNEDSFSDALNYNHILKEYMKRRED